MRTRALAVLVLVLAGVCVSSATATAAPLHHRDWEVQQIIRDCARDDRLDGTYRLGSLRRALDELPNRLRRTTDCERAIERAIRRADRRLDRAVERIIRDCARDDDLDRDFSVRELRAALRRLPDDVRDYTGCVAAITRAIRQAARRLDREAERILRDCSRDRSLDREYSFEGLWAALDRLVRGRCVGEIRRAIRFF